MNNPFFDGWKDLEENERATMAKYRRVMFLFDLFDRQRVSTNGDFYLCDNEQTQDTSSRLCSLPQAFQLIADARSSRLVLYR
jgi:hypothetical protein